MFIKKLVILLFITSSLSLAHAMDRALLIGVGEYKNNIKKLPGVALDIETMRDSAHILGFTDENIKVLLNEQVTVENLKKTIQDWLIDGTDSDDRVMIYYSGHGSRIPDLNNDEADGADEVLVLYDSEIVRQNNTKTLKNVLLDDEFGHYLQQIKSNDLMLFVDACNSGTIYRNMSLADNGAQGKFFNYPGMPQSTTNKASLAKNKSQTKSISNSFSLLDKDDYKQQDSASPVLQKAEGSRFVAITAAGDNELALATKKGSIFTQGLYFYLKQAAINQQPLTPKQLIDKVAIYIEQKVEEEKLGAVFQPQLAGSNQLTNKAISFVDAPLARVNWNRLEALDTAPIKLSIKSSKSKLRVGESINIDIEIPHQGYLNVITVGPDDSVFVLYPNLWETKNRVSPGTIHLPTKKMDFEIRLTEPAGKNLMLAVLTTRPINLYRQSIEGRDRSGRMFSSLKELARKVNKQQENTPAPYLSGRLVVEVEQ